MLATPDDISNLNLNNLAGSALGLWDYARTFLLSFPVLSFSLVAFCRSSMSPSFSRGGSLSCSLFFIRAAMVDTCTYEHAKPCVTYKVVTFRYSEVGW